MAESGSRPLTFGGETMNDDDELLAATRRAEGAAVGLYAVVAALMVQLRRKDVLTGDELRVVLDSALLFLEMNPDAAGEVIAFARTQVEELEVNMTHALAVVLPPP